MLHQIIIVAQITDLVICQVLKRDYELIFDYNEILELDLVEFQGILCTKIFIESKKSSRNNF